MERRSLGGQKTRWEKVGTSSAQLSVHARPNIVSAVMISFYCPSDVVNSTHDPGVSNTAHLAHARGCHPYAKIYRLADQNLRILSFGRCSLAYKWWRVLETTDTVEQSNTVAWNDSHYHPAITIDPYQLLPIASGPGQARSSQLRP